MEIQTYLYGESLTKLSRTTILQRGSVNLSSLLVISLCGAKDLDVIARPAIKLLVSRNPHLSIVCVVVFDG
jgi:hypothetical protein